MPALRLAGLVLRHLSVELATHDRGHLAAAFVVDMARAFEDFVTAAMSEALARHHGVVEGQRTLMLDTDGRWRPRPDLTHLVDGRVVAVLDAKYKAGHQGQYPLADVYQMSSYCTALGLDRGWLVYAKGFGPTEVRRLVNSEIEIARVALDIDRRPTEVLGEVAALARQVVAASPPGPGHAGAQAS